eukprot:m51a1_g2991 hypothetical protein (238) ;mRNA; f:749906-750917
MELVVPKCWRIRSGIKKAEVVAAGMQSLVCRQQSLSRVKCSECAKLAEIQWAGSSDDGRMYERHSFTVRNLCPHVLESGLVMVAACEHFTAVSSRTFTMNRKRAKGHEMSPPEPQRLHPPLEALEAAPAAQQAPEAAESVGLIVSVWTYRLLSMPSAALQAFEGRVHELLRECLCSPSVVNVRYNRLTEDIVVLVGVSREAQGVVALECVLDGALELLGAARGHAAVCLLSRVDTVL